MQAKAKTWVCVLVINAIAASMPGAVYARDPGINQPGSAGNFGRAAPGVDPGINHSEFRTRGIGGEYDEFVELFNPSGGSIDIGGWIILCENGHYQATPILYTPERGTEIVV